MPSPLTTDSFMLHLLEIGFIKNGHLYTKNIGPARIVVDVFNNLVKS